MEKRSWKVAISFQTAVKKKTFGTAKLDFMLLPESERQE